MSKITETKRELINELKEMVDDFRRYYPQNQDLTEYIGQIPK